MTICDGCGKLIGRIESENYANFCEKCMQKNRSIAAIEDGKKTQKALDIASYWTKPPSEQSKVREATKPTAEGLRCKVIFDHPYLKESESQS